MKLKKFPFNYYFPLLTGTCRFCFEMYLPLSSPSVCENTPCRGRHLACIHRKTSFLQIPAISCGRKPPVPNPNIFTFTSRFVDLRFVPDGFGPRFVSASSFIPWIDKVDVKRGAKCEWCCMCVGHACSPRLSAQVFRTNHQGFSGLKVGNASESR